LLKGHAIAFGSDQVTETPVKAKNPEGRGNNSEAYCGVSFLQSLHRFRVDHHALRHFAHRNVAPLTGDSNIPTQLLNLVDCVFG
jgi:hypothetical protein